MSYIGNSIINGTFRSEFFSGDDTTTAFTMAYGTGNEASQGFVQGNPQGQDVCVGAG
jgi:hypothetical protein